MENGLRVTPPMRTIMALAGAVVLELEDLTPETVRKALSGRFQPDLQKKSSASPEDFC